MRILFAGQVGESLPPLYAGVPKRALLLAKIWKSWGNEVGLCFTYRHANEDDLGAGARYFFEYERRPTGRAKLLFLLKAVCTRPILYGRLVASASSAYGKLGREEVLYAAYGVFLDTVVRMFKPDVIIAESGLHRSFFAARVAKGRGIPFILETYAEVHDPSIERFPSEDRRQTFWKTFLAMPDAIIAPSEYCACGPKQFAPEGKVRMIYATTLDVDAFERDHRTRAEARQQYGLPESDFLVLAVGSYAARKGHDHLIQAVAQLRRQGRRIGAVLCGEGNPDWLRKLAEQEGIVDHVRFFQNLSEDELRLLFRTADLYCDASNTPRACLGIALTEALATRLPAIAYDTAGLPEVVRDGENGYLVPLNDVAGLASAIERISALPDSERKALGERGFERARAVFDLPTIAKALLAEIRSASSIHGT